MRLFFGLLQTVGATAGLVLLIRTGVNRQSVAMAGATAGITILSRIAFRPPPGDREQRSRMDSIKQNSL